MTISATDVALINRLVSFKDIEQRFESGLVHEPDIRAFGPFCPIARSSSMLARMWARAW